MVSVLKILLHLKKRLPGTYPYRFLTYFRQQAMVFSSKDKAIIKNDYEEKSWTVYRICKEHESKKWVLSSVQHLLKRFKEDGSMKRRTGSGRPITVTTDENADLVEKLTVHKKISREHARVLVKSLEMLVSAEVW